MRSCYSRNLTRTQESSLTETKQCKHAEDGVSQLCNITSDKTISNDPLRVLRGSTSSGSHAVVVMGTEGVQQSCTGVEGIYAGSREQRMWRQRKKTRGEILSAGGNPEADRDAKCVSSRCSFDVRATAAAVCG
jgi:hypothetical protein